MLSRCFLDCSVGVGVFVTGLSQISSFFSYSTYPPPYIMNNVQIQNVTNHKHLGLTLNKSCTWHDHISDISSKAWKRINIFRSLIFKLDRKTLESIYFSFIRPTLQYADIVWDNCNTIDKYKGEVQAQMHSLLSRPGSDNSISLWCKLRHTIDISNYWSWFPFLDNCLVWL